MERVMGIEPTTSAWKAEVLPVNYTRNLITRFNDQLTFSIIHTIFSNVKQKCKFCRIFLRNCENDLAMFFYDHVIYQRLI